MSSRLVGKTAVVLGSTSGIGAATATEFAAQGASVLVSGRRADRGEAVVRDIEAAGGRALFRTTDASDPDQVRELIDAAVTEFGRLDILVNNPALALSKPFAEATTDDFETVMNTNARSYFVATTRALHHMTAQRSGSIICIGSITMEHPLEGTGLYAMAKGAVRAMIAAVAKEYGPYGIRINEITPGVIETELFDRPEGPELLELAASMSPLKTVGQPADVAALATYLASDEARFTTGAAFLVDGGMNI